LIIRERKHGQLWYLPAGRVEPGEDFFTAARREAEEEAGFPVKLTGIVRVEHTPHRGGETRMRVVFTGEPAEGPVGNPTGGPDAIDAAWVTPEEAEQFDLRADRLPSLFRYVAGGGRIYPLLLLTLENAPYV
jgi:phosphatase NudJ